LDIPAEVLIGQPLSSRQSGPVCVKYSPGRLRRAADALDSLASKATVSFAPLALSEAKVAYKIRRPARGKNYG
jgi:hypothetical protein